MKCPEIRCRYLSRKKHRLMPFASIHGVDYRWLGVESSRRGDTDSGARIEHTRLIE